MTGGLQVACVATLLCGVGCANSRPAAGGRVFEGHRAYAHVVSQCEIGTRVVGTLGGQKAAAYIQDVLKKEGWETERQEFTYRGVTAQNLLARRGSGPVVILGTHYDTRSIADRDPHNSAQPVLGANDGASGVAVLLELARSVDVLASEVELWFAFFDAEDQGNIDGWPFSVGAEYMAQRLAVRPQAVVVVDMVGDREQQMFWRQNSDQQLVLDIWATAADLGYANRFVPEWRSSITDDHMPFIERGIPGALIIDFDYRYWHTAADTPDKVSPESLESVGRVLETWLEQQKVPW